jgi:hypothetical protein
VGVDSVLAMVSPLHEALAEMVRNRPALVVDVLSDLFKLKLPEWTQVRLESNDFSEPQAVVFLADAPIALTKPDGTPLLGIVCEVQLSRDRRKWYSWPHYVTSLRARLKCPAMLLVICVDTGIAEWCAQPIEIGHPGWTLPPLVLGPEQLPVVGEHEARRSPEVAVLSAMAHGGGPRQQEVLQAAAHALRAVDQDHVDLYTDIVLGALPEAARRHLEALMNLKTYEPQSDFFRRWGDKREATGEARAVLAMLAARGVDVPDHARTRITECTDLDQLDTWVRRAATADSIDDVLD